MAAGWPLDVRPISLEDLDNLGIDSDGTLYWAGKPLVMQQRLILSLRQRVLAVVIGAFAVMAGMSGFAGVLAAGMDLGCRLHVFGGCQPQSLP